VVFAILVIGILNASTATIAAIATTQKNFMLGSDEG
jgi:hypothetical protein